MKKKDNVVPFPPDWKVAFQGTAMRTSFCLSLTQPMLEFLCAVADDVHWDRRLYSAQYGIARPDSWLSSSGALEKRGLVRSKTTRSKVTLEGIHTVSFWELTPAGEALVALLKVAGIFVEADAAIAKRAKT